MVTEATPVVEYIRYRISEERAAEFTAAYRAALQVAARNPHHHRHEVTQCIEEPERWVVRIEWDSVPGHMHGFRGSPEFREFFGHVRPFVADIEEMQHYRQLVPTAPPSLYEWAGGHEALHRWLTHFYDAVPTDPLLHDLFTPMPPHHAEHVARWLGEVLGGPAFYTEHLGGHPGMVGHHRGKRINEEQRRRWVAMLLESADEVGLPGDAEFRASLVGYIEWGSRLAVMFSAQDGPVDLVEPTPIWGWARPPWQQD